MKVLTALVVSRWLTAAYRVGVVLLLLLAAASAALIFLHVLLVTGLSLIGALVISVLLALAYLMGAIWGALFVILLALTR